MLNGQQLTPEFVGSVVMDRWQVLTTQAGKVEVLLAPSVFLRIADNSSVKMISPDLANIEVQVHRGRAMVEATDITKNNDIRVDLSSSKTQLLKNGLYDFDLAQGQIRVFNGKAEVSVNNQKIGAGEHHQVSIKAAGKLKAQDFDSKQYSDEFYLWSGLRSDIWQKLTPTHFAEYHGPYGHGFEPHGGFHAGGYSSGFHGGGGGGGSHR